KTPMHWEDKGTKLDFFDLKGIIENLLGALKVPSFHFVQSAHTNLHPGRQAALIIGEKEVGILGEVHPLTLEKMDIAQPLYFAEMLMEDLRNACTQTLKMRPLPLYPSSSRDWTVTVPRTLSAMRLFSEMEQAKTKLVEEISLIDVYHSEKLGSEVKNMTFRFVYRDHSKTISVQEVEREHEQLTSQIMKKLTSG
ncbi:MAG: hypothetical protein ACKVOH_01705, partial [Chlamydiales bacterium]